MSIENDNPPPRPERVEPLSASDLDQLCKRYLRKVEIGLDSEGLPSRRRWPGLHVKVDGVSLRVWVTPYHDHRWWRISCSTNPPGGMMPDVLSELTMCASEFDDRAGVHVARLLRNCKYVWPLFGHHPCYPSYAWSVQAWDGFQQDYRARKAFADWHEARGLKSGASPR